MALIAWIPKPAIAQCTWSLMTSPTSERLMQPWGTSGSDVFAVGYNGTIIHYDGTDWTTMTSPTSERLFGVWGTSGSDVFAVGYNGTIIHYDGTDWSTMTSPTSENLFSVWGTFSSDVFAVGCNGTIIHYDGTDWTTMSSPTTNRIHEVWGTSGSDVFAVAIDGIIIHYDGTDWSTMTSPTTQNIYGVWGTSGSDVFAAAQAGTILHYNGTDWSIMNTPTSVNNLWGVWGSSGSDVFVVGYHGYILHYNGTDWSIMTSPTSEYFYGDWGSSGSDVFAVGNNGTIVHYGPAAIFDISGNIGYFSDDAPVPNAEVNLTEVDYTATTDEFGEYLFEDIPGGNYVSTPSKDEDLGGLSGMDASRIARYAAGLYSLDCLEMIAGDVSMNGEISGMDASRVARYAVGTITELNDDGIEWVFTPEPIPDCADWPPIVYESTREYSPLNSDLTDEDFIGIRLGDVSGNWSPDSRAILSSESFESTEIEINTNSTLRIPIVIEEATAIEGIDISIAFNKEVLHLSGLTLGGILTENDYAVESNLKDGKIVIYAQKELVSGAGVFAFIDFDVIGEVGSSSDIYLTKFDVNETEASGGFNVVDSENETVTRRLQIDVGQTLLEKFALYTNNPNPFSTRTLIQYDLPKDTHVNIQVYNVKGQLVEELVNGIESAGRKQIEWDTKDSSSGIYFYRLSTEDKTIIKKMVLMR